MARYHCAQGLGLAQGYRLARPVTLGKRVAERIVTLRQQGLSTPRIAALLNQQQVPTARGGARWYPSTVTGVLRSANLDAFAASVGEVLVQPLDVRERPVAIAACARRLRR